MQEIEEEAGFRMPEPVQRAVELAQERKATGLLVLDLQGISSATDFFVICSGRSDIQVRAISEHLLEELKEDGVGVNHVEGLQAGRWVLLDYIDFVIHVFHPGAREFYQLETLWGDAPRMSFPDEEEGEETDG